MSTMKVTNLKHESSSVNNIVLNSDGSVGGELATTLASKLDLAGGKILQIVRATDTTSRSTTSTSFVDVTGMAVSITPQKSDSEILVLSVFSAAVSSGVSGTRVAQYQITDSADNALSGAENMRLIDVGTTVNTNASITMIGRSTPATTSAVTYKVRFRAGSASETAFLRNDTNTGQVYAIEVSA